MARGIMRGCARADFDGHQQKSTFGNRIDGARMRTTDDRMAAHRKLDRRRDDLYGAGLRAPSGLQEQRVSPCQVAFLKLFSYSVFAAFRTRTRNFCQTIV
jgi:hypothetical protein